MTSSPIDLCDDDDDEAPVQASQAAPAAHSEDQTRKLQTAVQVALNRKSTVEMDEAASLNLLIISFLQ